MFTVGFDISALDPSFKEHAHRGIGRYVTELKRYFDGFKHDLVSVQYFSHQDLFSGDLVKPFLAALPAGVSTIRQQVIFPLQLARREEWSMVHFPAHMDGPAWGQKRRVLTVLDLIPLVLEELYRPEKNNLRFRFARALENRAIKSATHLIAISECTKRDIIRMLGVPEERITVTPLGVDARFFDAVLRQSEEHLRARLGLPTLRPIVLYVGGIDERKNIHWMLEVWRALVGNFAADDVSRPVLCLAGEIATHKQFPALKQKIKESDLQRDVILPGFVNDEDLLQLFAISRLFFFPSLYEGFGLPPLEAMAAGLPVLALNTSSMPEVIGRAAELIEPQAIGKVGSVATTATVRALLELLKNNELCMERKNLGRAQARKFTWQATGEKTFQVYERLACGV